MVIYLWSWEVYLDVLWVLETIFNFSILLPWNIINADKYTSNQINFHHNETSYFGLVINRDLDLPRSQYFHFSIPNQLVIHWKVLFWIQLNWQSLDTLSNRGRRINRVPMTTCSLDLFNGCSNPLTFPGIVISSNIKILHVSSMLNICSYNGKLNFLPLLYWIQTHRLAIGRHLWDFTVWCSVSLWRRTWPCLFLFKGSSCYNWRILFFGWRRKLCQGFFLNLFSGRDGEII